MALAEHAGLVGDEIAGGQAEQEKGQRTLELLPGFGRFQVRGREHEEAIGDAAEEQGTDAEPSAVLSR